MKVLAFTGPAGSGKSLCAELLQQMGKDQGLKVVRVSFADPLKKICSDVYCFAYDLPPTAFYGTLEQKGEDHEVLGGRSGREILQFLGTGCFKALTPDVWSKYLVRHCEVASRYGADLVVVDDLRFKDEAEAIRELGGYIVRLQRAAVPNGVGIPNHVSEKEYLMIDTDEVIVNNGDSIALQRALQRFL